LRALRASRIDYDAEVRRVRLYARRLPVRLVQAVAALAFLGCTMTCAHVAAWYWLRLDYGWQAHTAAILLAVGDLVVGGVLATVALCLGPGPAEREARLARQQARRAIVETTVFPMLVVRVLRLVRLLRRRVVT
jgi:hypothetical protein